MLKTEIKSVKDIYFLNRLPVLMSLFGTGLCIFIQNKIHAFSIEINWASVLFVFFIFFYLPSSLILGIMLAKYRKKSQENKKMFIEIKGVKKLFWKIYLIPYLLICFNLNLFLPLKLEHHKDGLAPSGSIVWHDYRFAGKGKLHLKVNDWASYIYRDTRGEKKYSFGIVKQKANSLVIIGENGLSHFLVEVEIQSKLTDNYPLWNLANE